MMDIMTGKEMRSGILPKKPGAGIAVLAAALLAACAAPYEVKQKQVENFVGSLSGIPTVELQRRMRMQLEECRRGDRDGTCAEKLNRGGLLLFDAGLYAEGKEALLAALDIGRSQKNYHTGTVSYDTTFSLRPTVYWNIHAASRKTGDQAEQLATYQRALANTVPYVLADATDSTSGSPTRWKRVITDAPSQVPEAVRQQVQDFVKIVLEPIQLFHSSGMEKCTELIYQYTGRYNEFRSARHRCQRDVAQQVAALAEQAAGAIEGAGFTVPEFKEGLATTAQAARAEASMYQVWLGEAESALHWDRMGAQALSALRMMESAPGLNASQRASVNKFIGLLSD